MLSITKEEENTESISTLRSLINKIANSVKNSNETHHNPHRTESKYLKLDVTD